MSTIFEIGDTVGLRLPFVGEDGNPLDPETVTVEIVAPDRTRTSYTWAGSTTANIVRDSLGVFIWRAVAALPAGRYFWWSVGVDTNPVYSAADQGDWVVKAKP